MSIHETDPRIVGNKGGDRQTDPFAVRRNNGSGLRSISEALPGFHSELSKATEQALIRSPEEKIANRRAKYLIEISVWASLQDGLSEEEKEAQAARMRAGYDRFGREGQIILYQDLHDSNEHEIAQRFKERLDLQGKLRTEAGETPEVLAKARDRSEKVFADVPRTSKTEEFRHMDSAIQHLLVVNFPRYLSEYEEVIAFEDSRDAAIQAKVSLASRRFQKAETEEEKAAISRKVREGNRKWLADQFSSYIVRYEGLVRAGMIKSDRKRFIPLGIWQEKFRNAATFEDRVDLLRAFRYVLSPYDDLEIVQSKVAEPTKINQTVQKYPQTDQDIFVEAVNKGVIEDFDGLEEAVRRNLGIAVNYYEKLLKSQGTSGKEARRVAQAKADSIFSKIFVGSGKAAFGSVERPKDLREGLDFMFGLVSSRQVPQTNS